MFVRVLFRSKLIKFVSISFRIDVQLSEMKRQSRAGRGSGSGSVIVGGPSGGRAVGAAVRRSLQIAAAVVAARDSDVDGTSPSSAVLATNTAATSTTGESSSKLANTRVVID